VTSYAVIQTGGKQYQVKSGDVIDVEKLEAEVGTRVELADVRLVSVESGLSVGTPSVDGAMVTAEVQDQFRGPKIIIFKYKSKTHYRKKNGHRQSYTRIRIQDILTGGATPPPFVPTAKVEVAPAEAVAPEVAAAPAPARRARAAAATTAAATAETTEAPAAPAKRTRTRAATAATTTEATTEEKPAPAKRRTRAAVPKETPAETSEETQN
jgi:large subunit ribosomal protein L21